MQLSYSSPALDILRRCNEATTINKTNGVLEKLVFWNQPDVIAEAVLATPFGVEMPFPVTFNEKMSKEVAISNMVSLWAKPSFRPSG